LSSRKEFDMLHKSKLRPQRKRELPVYFVSEDRKSEGWE
jgi:hypothetical protein